MPHLALLSRHTHRGVAVLAASISLLLVSVLPVGAELAPSDAPAPGPAAGAVVPTSSCYVPGDLVGDASPAEIFARACAQSGLTLAGDR